jgi:small subunit ribosomal protein S4
MGDPRKHRRKYDTPQHPWEGKRIEEERVILNQYGLKNKAEIWKVSTALRKIKQQARQLIAADNEQAKKEEKQLIEKLVSLNLVSKDAKIDEILSVNLEKMLDRRLQTQVFLKGLARSPKQARQFITHKHIMVGDSIVNKPSYLVRKSEENSIAFSGVSVLSKPDHPERDVDKKEKMEPKEKKDKK